MGKLKDKTAVTQMTDADYILGVFGGATGKMSIDNFRRHINDDDKQLLKDLAIYVKFKTTNSIT